MRFVSIAACLHRTLSINAARLAPYALFPRTRASYSSSHARRILPRTRVARHGLARLRFSARRGLAGLHLSARHGPWLARTTTIPAGSGRRGAPRAACPHPLPSAVPARCRRTRGRLPFLHVVFIELTNFQFLHASQIYKQQSLEIHN